MLQSSLSLTNNIELWNDNLHWDDINFRGHHERRRLQWWSCLDRWASMRESARNFVTKSMQLSLCSTRSGNWIWRERNLRPDLLLLTVIISSRSNVWQLTWHHCHSWHHARSLTQIQVRFHPQGRSPGSWAQQQAVEARSLLGSRLLVSSTHVERPNNHPWRSHRDIPNALLHQDFRTPGLGWEWARDISAASSTWNRSGNWQSEHRGPRVLLSTNKIATVPLCPSQTWWKWVSYPRWNQYHHIRFL